MPMSEYQYRGLRLAVSEQDGGLADYFAAAAEGRLLMRKCNACSLMHYPPATACPFCAEADFAWQEVSGKGTLYSYELVTQAIQPQFADWLPYPIAIIELDEQRGQPTEFDGLRLLTNLVNADGDPEAEENFKIGDRVQVTFTKLADDFALPQFTIER
jgi:uncharacterized OB-fold protein